MLISLNFIFLIRLPKPLAGYWSGGKWKGGAGEKRSDRTICLGSTLLSQVFYSYPEQTLNNLSRSAAQEKPHIDRGRLSL